MISRVGNMDIFVAWVITLWSGWLDCLSASMVDSIRRCTSRD